LFNVSLPWTGFFLILPPTDLITCHICNWLTLALQTDRTWVPLKCRYLLIIPHSTVPYRDQNHKLNSCCIQMHLYVLHAKVTKFQTVNKCSIDYNVPL
jgi:hypothetical protein